jgi:hypothetical protein
METPHGFHAKQAMRFGSTGHSAHKDRFTKSSSCRRSNMADEQHADDGTQKGPGEQILPRPDEENSNLDNLRGGADPSGGQSSEVPRANGKDNPGAQTSKSGQRDTSPLSTPSEGSTAERPTEDDLAKKERRGGDE